MSMPQATSSRTEPTPPRGNDAAAAVPPGLSAAETDASCRPLLALFFSAALWLVAGSILGLVTSLKLHAPNLLADCAWLTYGRTHPAAVNALVYGAAMQAGLGVLLWLVCQLGRSGLAAPALVLAGWLLWNAGVTVGVLGILGGGNTGFEWLEVPRYGAALLFLGYVAVALAGLVSFHRRIVRELSLSHWFLLAALFWFPWIHSTAQFLLVAQPVRGTLQAVIAWWYANNLVNIWFAFAGLAVGFYFLPKLTNRSLYGYYLGLFAFFMLAFFASWGGVPADAPVPAWLSELSSLATALTIVPILAIALNIWETALGNRMAGERSSFGFIRFGMLAYVVAGFMNWAASLLQVNEITNFTWFIPAQNHLMVYGFFAMTMFGAIYYIVPRLAGFELSAKLERLHYWLAAAGVLIYALPLAIGGIKQGLQLKDATIPFFDVMKGTLMFVRASTLGELLLLAGSLLLLVNFIGLLVRAARACCAATVRGGVRTAEAAA